MTKAKTRPDDAGGQRLVAASRWRIKGHSYEPGEEIRPEHMEQARRVGAARVTTVERATQLGITQQAAQDTSEGQQ